jgi:DHA1 family bicyclomycin/chloramphenicol resistance-like MFS transporter
MSNPKPNRSVIILILGALMTISPFAIDMYLPAFSQIAGDIGTTSGKLSLTVSSYFVGFAIGQLLYGPLLDKYGRKKPLYFGLLVYIAACIGCMLSKSVEVMIAFRFIQALGGCVAGVAALTMVRDFFPVQETARIISLLILILGVSPLLAPSIGGFIAEGLGWQWIFIILIIVVVLVMALVVFFLPDGRKPDPTISLRAGPMMNIFVTILKNPQFYTYALSGALSFTSLLLYVGGSPVIFMDIFHVSPKTYGLIFALLSIGFIGSNQLNILLLRRFRSDQLLKVALTCQLVTTVVFLVGAVNGWYGLSATIVLIFICLACLGLTYPNASALALAPFTDNVGSSSALVGFLQIGVSGIASAGLGMFNPTSSVPMATIMAFTSLLAFVILLSGKKAAIATAAGANSGFTGSH